MKFKHGRANLRKSPVVYVESLESRVLYSADVFSGLGIDQPTAVEELISDHWPPHGGQQTVLPVAESTSVDFKRTISVAEPAATTLDSTPQPDSESGIDELDSEISENPISADNPQSFKELVFIDSRTPDYQAMVDDLRANHPDTEFELIIIDSDEDGIDKISSTLANVDPVTAIHIISHGSGGAVQLGSVILNDNLINERGDELLEWSDELTDDADILIYGCNLAATDEGVSLIDNIALLTDADVAASDDTTGHESLGGNWQLEYVTGEVTTDIVFSPDLQANWVGKLEAVFVTNFDDMVNGDVSSIANLIDDDGGDGISLREAIIASNSPFNVPDTIFLESGLYELSISGTDDNSGDLDINGPLHIIGASDGSTVIDAKGIDRVFEVRNGTTTFENLTIQGGNQTSSTLAGGGALLVGGGAAGAILDSVVIRNNSTSDNGGGIRSNGNLTVTNTVIENNSAQRGGGVALTGGIGSIDTTTISGNTSTTQGGGVVASSGLSTHSITNTTISGNTAATGGGFQNSGAPTQIINSTITNNEATVDGGGIKRESGSVTVDGTIVAGNISPSAVEVFGNISSAGNNIIGNDPGDSNGGAGYSTSDLQNETNLALGPLQDNGGFGQTHELLPGSAGIDPGNTSASGGIDGRGFTRDADHDTGAFEFGVTPPSAPATFLLATEENVSSSGANGLSSWTDGEVLQVTDVSIEPGVSEGTFDSFVNLNTFVTGGGVEIDAIHIVSAPITVGGGTASFSLQPGDLLLSVVDDETFTSNNTLTVSGGDVFVFQPTTFGDYSSGTFTKLLQGGGAGGSPILDSINGITLVESAVTVGSISLQPGDFLFSRDNGFGTSSGDIFQFRPSGVGDSATDGTVDLFLDANNVSIFSQVDAIDIAETALQINGTTIDQGSLLLSLDTFELATGNNSIATNRQDIFSLELTAAGINSAGDASLVLEGLDVGLDSDAEDVNAFSIHGDILPPVTANIPPEANPNSSSGSEDQLLPVTISGTDSDGTVDNFEINSIPLNGTLYSDVLLTNVVAANDVLPASAPGTLELWFDPDQDWNGTTDFDFSVFDDQGLISASPATSTITIAASNDSPVINSSVSTLFINEIHYDDDANDNDEAVEIAGSAGTDLAGWTLYLYNGANGLRYDTVSLSGVIPDQDSGFGTLSFGFPVGGVQNGPADGVALVDNTGSLIEFLSYEGVVTAVDGPLAGLTSQDIGVEETNSTVEGTSIQLTDSGWVAGLAETFDQPNTSQDLSVTQSRFPTQTVNEDTDLVFSALNGNELTISDVDAGTDAVEVTLSVVSGTLSITNLPGAITDLTGNGTSTVSFLADTLSATSALDALTYRGAQDFNGADILQIVVDDQGNNGGAAQTAIQNIDIIVQPVNDAPVLSTIELAPAFYFENSATGITGNLSVSDVDNTDIESATITISNNHIALEDNLSFTGQFGITGSYSNGTLNLTGSATLAEYETVIHSVVYSNSSEDPDPATRTVEITVNDGDVDSNTLSRDVEVIPVNDAPVESGIESAVLSYVENSGSAVVSNTLSLADIDDVNLQGATVQIGSYISGEDVLLFADTSAISHIWDPVNGVLTLNGADTVANYQAALRSITYENNSNNPTTGALTVSFTVSDGDVNSNVEFRAVNIVAVNDAPSLATIEAMPAIHIENGLATGITGNLDISDVDDAQIESATVTISGNYVPGEDFLLYNPQAGITGTFSNGTLTLMGSASQIDYETAIHSVTYSNINENPSAAIRTVEITINDGDVNSNTLSRDVEVIPVNDAPVESGIEASPLLYIESSGSAVVSNTLALSDSDDVNLDGATVQINGYVNGEDTLLFTDTATIAGVWNPSTGVLTLTGTDTVANYQAALRSVAYENSSVNPVSNQRTVAFTVFDGDANSNIESRLINIGAVNNAPVLATIEVQPASYIENAPAAGITGNLSISDVDDTQIESATVTISNNYVAGEDQLAFTPQAGISGTFTNGTLTLSGSATLADYEAVIHSVTYETASENPTGATRTVEITVNDGDVDSNAMSRDIEVIPVNDAPVLATIEVQPAAYIENAASVGITGNLSISDVDDTQIESATVTISNNYVADEDLLTFVPQFGISGTFVNGTLTLTGSATVAEYEAVIHSVAYETISENPTTATRTIDITVNDGDVYSNPLSRDIEVISVNDAPDLSTIEVQPAVYIENAVPIGITGNLSISDIDDTQIESASVTISNNYVAGEDLLTFTPQAGISGTFLNGTLSLSGSATLADYEAVIHSVAFESSGENPSTATRTVEITVNDADVDSNPLSRDIEVIAVNDAPQLATIEVQPAAYVENSAPIGITGNLSISDVDDSQIVSATVTISNNYLAGEDVLGFTSQFGITGSFSNGTLSLTGTATLAEYEAVIHSVIYTNSSENPSAATRTVEITVNDGDANSSSLSRDVEVIPVNDAPVGSSIESAALFYLENSGPALVSNSLALSDSDDGNLESATIQIGGYVSGEDSLSFIDTATITHIWDPATGVLTLSGTDTVANYQAALRSVTYENSSANPVVSPRTVAFTVFDGDVDSNAEVRVINVGVVNNAPVLATIEAQPAGYVENAAGTGITGNLSISDVDDTQIESATVTISSDYVAGEDQLTFVPQAGISGSFLNGTLTLTGSATLADYEAAIHSVTYSNTSDNPSVATRTVEITVNDGDANSNPLSRDVEVISVNDAPDLATIEVQPAAFIENSAPVGITGNLSISDVDDTQITSATVVIRNNYVAGEDFLTFVPQSGISGTFVNGTLTLAGVATLTDYEAVIHSVAYETTSENPTGATRTVEITVNDGDVDSNAMSRDIEVIPVNDAPVLATIEVQPVVYIENGASVGITGNLSITDVDDMQIESATVTISNNFVAGEDLLTFTPTPDIGGTFFNGALTLTGSATLADYEAAIHSVTYSNTSENPSTATRTVEITVNDGDIDSNVMSRDIDVLRVNDAPVLATIELQPATYIENSAPVGITGNLSISDVDDTQIESATVTISGNFSAGEDLLTFVPQSGINGTFANGTLLLTGSATIAEYEAVIHSVVYLNNSENPSAATRTVEITVNDGDANSNTMSRDVEVIPVNDAPVESSVESAALFYFENSGAVVVSSTINLSDIDDVNLEAATVQINGYVSGEDTLSFTDTAAITHIWDPATGVLTLIGTDTVAGYQAALRSITYENSSTNPVTSSRTVAFTVFDGDADSNVQSRVINISTVNNAPVLSSIEALPASYIENTSGTGITGNLSISDVDDIQIESATVTISGSYVAGEDQLAFVPQSGISGTFANGTLILTGSATVAEYEAAIHSVVYSNSSENPSSATRTVEITVNDGDAISNSLSRDVEVVPVNDAPVESGIESAAFFYVENSGTVVVSNTINLSDIDDVNLEAATVQIGGYVNGEDVLSFANTANIAGVWNPSAGILSLTGTDTVANYQAALRSIAYENNSTNPVSSPRTISFTVSDGDVNSNVESRVINIDAVNNAPILATIETQPVSYTENAAATGITGNLSISDVDDTQIESATIAISNNYVAGEDELTFTPMFGIGGTFSNGTLTLTGSATVAEYEAVIHSVAYSNNSENPSVATRTVEITVNDGDADSNTMSRDISVSSVNDAPELSSIEVLPANYTENAVATGITGNLSIGDVDDALIESAIVMISNNYVAGEDVLSFNSQLASQFGIAGSFSNGTLNLSGSATLAQYETVIHSVTYINTSNDPAAVVRTVEITVNDGVEDSNALSRDVEVVPVNDAPVGAGIESAALVYPENSGAAVVSNTLSLSDLDDVNLEGATVQIGGYVNGEDLLTFADTANISAVWNPSTGTLTLSGTDTVAGYQSALRSVAYENASNNPVTSPRAVAFIVQDGDANSNVQIRTIEVGAVNNSPTLATIESQPASYTENTAPIAITGNLLVSDVDDIEIQSATVTISGNYIASEDILSFTDQFGIAGAYSNGTLTLTGAASVANYEAAIHSVTYENTSENPSTATRTVEIRVNDGVSDSNALSRDIVINPVNDVPVISTVEAGPLVYTENTLPGAISSTLSLSDIDNVNLAGATVKISDNFNSTEDTLLFTDTNAITHSWDPLSGTLVLTGTDTVANYQAALRSVTYLNASDSPSPAQRTIDFSVTDTEQGASVVAQREIQIVAVNDEPSGTDNTVITLEDTPYVFTAAEFGYNDNLDNDLFDSLLIATVPSEGSLVLDGTALNAGDIVTRADIDSGLLVYQPEENINGSNAATFDFQVQDNGGTLNSGIDTDATANTITIDLVAVNDAPNSADSLITIAEEMLHIFSTTDFQFTDIDGDQLSGIIIDSLPEVGMLVLSGSPVVAGDFISVSQITDGEFVLLPMPGEPDATTSGFDYRVTDNGSTLNGGSNTDTTSNRIDFNIAGVNDGPEIITNATSVDEGDTLVITDEFLSGFDPDDTDPQDLTFTVQNLPLNGELNLAGSLLAAGDNFTLADIVANRLSYEHDGSETEADTIEFLLADGGEDGALPSVGQLSLLIREVIDSAPMAVDDQIVLSFGESFDSTTGDVLASGNNVLSGQVLMENPGFTLEIVEEPEHGTVNLLPNGTFMYQHNGSSDLIDQFSYRIINEDGIFTVATVNIFVEPPFEAAQEPVQEPGPVPEPVPELIAEVPDFVIVPESVDLDAGEDSTEVEVETAEEVAEVIEEAGASSLAEFEVSTRTNLASSESLLQELGISTFDLQGADGQERSESLLVALEVIKHNSIRTTELYDVGSDVELQRIDVEFEIEDTRVGISNTNFLRALQQVDSDLQEADTEQSLKIQLSNDAVFGISISATAGIVAWALRGGALLASVMAATPIWASIDPLRVVNSKEENEDNSDSSEVEKIFE